LKQVMGDVSVRCLTMECLTNIGMLEVCLR